MLDNFPPDQADLIRSRLGPILAELEAEYDAMEPKESELPKTSADRIRGEPRMAHPVTAFYWQCLKEMGSAGAASGGPPRLPNASQAWFEVYKQAPKNDEAVEHGNLTEPTFSHPKVAEVVGYFGGWQRMWQEFLNIPREIRMQKSRSRFEMAYKKLVEGQ